MRTLGLSPLDSARCDLVLDLPAHSPVTHGMLRLEVDVVDGVVVHAVPVLGAMHRGAEKLFESRDYRQVLSLANRHEWLASFAGELGVALLIEREMGIPAPDHAAWLRTLLMEYHRVASHLAFLAGHPDLADVAQGLRQLREQWVEQLQVYTGTRMHAMVTVIGGLSNAPGVKWLRDVQALAERSADVISATAAGCESAPDGVGIVDAVAVADQALSGPVARAAGVELDLRAADPGLRYGQLASFRSPVFSGGDSRDRLRQLAAEASVALECITECAAACAERDGEPVNVLLPKVLRVPVGEYARALETPLGVAQWLLVSTGDKMPTRLALRPASLHTVLALEVALRGARIEDAARIVASMPFTTGDAER